MSKNLVFEIGTEEIPARFLPSTIKQIYDIASEQFAICALNYQSIKVFVTPRRLTLFVEGLEETQADSLVEAKGPALAAAFDPEGNPSKAFLGFCKGQGIEPVEAGCKEINGVKYVFIQKHIAGKETVSILPTIFKSIITKLNFPKPMRWGYGDFRFARPIHWLLALFGTEIVPFEFEGVQSGRSSKGHRVLGSDNIMLASADVYEAELQNNFVIVDQEKRRDLIENQIKKVAEDLNGKVADDHELLEEVTFLVEYPTALAGNFDEKYLNIPKELVITPMREHQRYFPVYNQDGKLLPKFITVRNGDAYGIETVAAGNEKVLRARLSDAEFFWKKDLQSSLHDNNTRLNNIVFHEKLGSVLSKVHRIEKLSCFIGKELAYDSKALQQTAKTASLCKADLVSRAVCEFTELQGIMGEYYALADGVDKTAAQGIREHYLPCFAGDTLPQTLCGQAVALADKLDSLCSFFALDMIPSGSQDPYALRRAAAGCVRIIIENGLELDLRKIFAYAFSLIKQDVAALVFDEKMSDRQLLLFMKQRLEKSLQDEGIAYDVINAVFAVPSYNLYDIRQKALALTCFRSEDSFAVLLAGFKRAANLLKNTVAKGEIEAGVLLPLSELLLLENEEKELYGALCGIEAEVQNNIINKEYEQALSKAGALSSAIDAFFNGIMVMTEDAALRRNRLALLSHITALTASIGDLSCLVD